MLKYTKDMDLYLDYWTWSTIENQTNLSGESQQELLFDDHHMPHIQY